MKVLLVALLALGSGVTAATTATLGHEPPPRQTSQAFPLTLDAVALGPGGSYDLSGENCVVLRARGAAVVLGGHAILDAAEERPASAGEVRLEATGPRAGIARAIGGLPLRLELSEMTFTSPEQAAHVGARLPDGALSFAAQQRFTLTLSLEHTGAPLRLGVTACPEEQATHE